MRRAVVSLLVSLCAAALGPAGAASLAPLTALADACPTNVAYPNDPEYDAAEQGNAGHTWDGEDWYLYGCMPAGLPLSSDPEGASGMSIDRTWASYTKGRDDLVVAYMEGGVNWRIGSSCELKDRAWLNKGELPYPERADGSTKTSGDPWDLNGDGVFNVEDYLVDPRVTQVTAPLHHSPPGSAFLHNVCSKQGIPAARGGTDITPEDLIAAFGNCQVSGGQVVGTFPCNRRAHFDNDNNGYANDINGWNFNRDTNDPQTEQSIYGHFNGESGQLVGEGNNSFGGIGLCPLCRYVPIKAGDEAIDRPDRVAEAIVYAADIGVKVMDVTDASLGTTPEMGAAIDYAYHKGMLMTWASNDFESADHTDGMFWPHVWPGNSLTGDHSTRGSATCNVPPSSTRDAFCGFVKSNTTFRSRSSLTSYGPHALFSVPNNDGSTSTGIPTQAGVAALVMAEGMNAAAAGHIATPLDPEETRQVVRSTASYIGSLPTCPTCFQGIASGTKFNIMYGYGRPNVFKAAQAVDMGQVPPTADIRTPSWYQEVDPTKVSSLNVTADVAARRQPGGAYTWELQYGLGPQPLDSDFQTFASGSASGARTVAGTLDLTKIPASFWSGAYSVDPATRLSIERYDVTIRARVFAGGDTSTGWKYGEDRRAFHLRHDDTELPGFPVAIGPSGDSSPTMADIEGRGWLDIVFGTADGAVHAIRPDGTEAPGFPVRTDVAPGMNPAYDTNYLRGAGWKSGLPRPHDGSLSPVAVGDLRHDGGLEIVMSTFSGYTYAWDGAGRRLPGFPVLNGDPRLFHYYNPLLYQFGVPSPDTPYSFESENITGGAPVLADLDGDKGLDIIQAAGDNHVYAWKVTKTGVEQVPGWPVCSIILPQPPPNHPCIELQPTEPTSVVHTHDAKIVPTPGVVDINGDGVLDVVVGLVDTTWDNASPTGSNKITSYLLAFSGKGTQAPNGGMLAHYPAPIPGLIQGYGVAQDFVTQGVESPAIFDSSSGPKAVLNSNLFLPVVVDLTTGAASTNPFTPSVIPPTNAVNGISPNTALVQFTTSPSLGRVVPLLPTPQAFQAGSSSLDVAAGITQTPGLGIRVDNGLGGWDTSTGLSLPNFAGAYIQGLAFFSAPAIADVTGDGVPDVLTPGDSAALTAFDGVTGRAASGFPKWTGGWSLWTPAIGDLKGSGKVAVAEVTREGFVHAWSTTGKASANHEAWHWHQDDRNTGHYGGDTRPPAGVRDVTVSAGQLTWTAPGDDWNSGTAARYEVRAACTPITQDTFAAATGVNGVPAPHSAGTKETLAVTPLACPGATYYAVRAVDAAGNIGPVQMPAPVPAPPPVVAGGNPLPDTAAASIGLAPFGGMVAIGVAMAIIRRRRRPLSARQDAV